MLAFGQQKPVVVDRRGVIVAGSGLYQAARALGWQRIAAVQTGLQGTERTGYAIADNRTAELAEWDWEALGPTLRELAAADFDVGLLAFDAETLAAMLEHPGGPPGPEAWEDAASRIPSGGPPEIVQMAFSLSSRQADTVRRALAAASNGPPFDERENANRNGNALARIAEAYLAG